MYGNTIYLVTRMEESTVGEEGEKKNKRDDKTPVERE